MTRLHLQGLTGPIESDAMATEVIAELQRVLIDWPVTTPTGDEPFLKISRSRASFQIQRTADNWRCREHDVADAVCTSVVEIVANFIQRSARLACLHAAAVEVNGRLVLFPATHRTGKSTLAAALGAAGHRVFADDLLPIDVDTRQGVATGCLPRLRLPLPSSLEAPLRSRIAENCLLTGARYAYLAADPSRRVPHGARADIGAIVLLERSMTACEAHMEPASADEALLRLLLQDTRDAADQREAFATYLRSIESTPLLRLRYHSPTDAVVAIERAFAVWPPARSAASITSSERPDLLRGWPYPPLVASDAPVWRRKPGVFTHRVERSGFLIDVDRNDVHHLNIVGLAIWEMLSSPVTADAVAEHLIDVYADAEATTIRRDVTAMWRRLAKLGLIEKAA